MICGRGFCRRRGMSMERQCRVTRRSIRYSEHCVSARRWYYRTYPSLTEVACRRAVSLARQRSVVAILNQKPAIDSMA